MVETVEDKDGERIKVTWVKNGLRSEKVFSDTDEAAEYMAKLEKSGAMYFWDWYK